MRNIVIKNIIRVISALLILQPQAFAEGKSVYGIYEKVKIMDLDGIIVKAKLDTGAHTTSFGATDIKRIIKKGQKWVRFKPQIKDQDLPLMELPLVRNSRIKRRMADIQDESKSNTRRPVVLMNLCFDSKIYPVEVNLTDRSRFNYPLLIGVTALVDFKTVIDPSLKFQSSPDCKN